MAAAKILVIEDNPANLELATFLLEVEGHVVLQATTAEEGIALAKAQSPDVIVMDVGLPGMDGLEATRVLRKDPATKDIPVIAATSHAMKGDKEQIMAAGCDDYVAKPLDTRTFAQQVARHVGMRRGT